LHHQWKPNELRVESLPEKTVESLRARGHNVVTVRSSGAAQIVFKTDQGFEAAHDPRLEGKAAAW
jgi:gamma-glutamyltranspeptidase / glutathione hydrolase